MSAVAEAIGRYRFAQDYGESRLWFRAAARHAGGTLDAAVCPHGAAPDGQELATDVAWFGAPDAERVLLSISGTHGTEHLPGAALQMQWMLHGPRPGEGIAVCLVHAHNPWGAAWLSRANENFVDLNRNYLDRFDQARPNPLYPALFDLLFTVQLDEHVLDDVMDAFYAYAERSDPQQLMTAMGGGQLTHPSGLIYCGSRREWSTENLRAIVRNRLGTARRVAVLDWHTGLGPFGEANLMANASGVEAEDRWVHDWWGGTAAGEALQGPTPPQFIGQVASGVAAELRARGAFAVSGVVELGTFENRGVLMSLLIDRWLRFCCTDPQSGHAMRMRSLMAQWLNPVLPEWRASVLTCGAEIYRRTLEGLAAPG
jgi:hypothetical protein